MLILAPLEISLRLESIAADDCKCSSNCLVSDDVFFWGGNFLQRVGFVCSVPLLFWVRVLVVEANIWVKKVAWWMFWIVFVGLKGKDEFINVDFSRCFSNSSI